MNWPRIQRTIGKHFSFSFRPFFFSYNCDDTNFVGISTNIQWLKSLFLILNHITICWKLILQWHFLIDISIYITFIGFIRPIVLLWISKCDNEMVSVKVMLQNGESNKFEWNFLMKKNLSFCDDTNFSRNLYDPITMITTINSE